MLSRENTTVKLNDYKTKSNLIKTKLNNKLEKLMNSVCDTEMRGTF